MAKRSTKKVKEADKAEKEPTSDAKTSVSAPAQPEAGDKPASAPKDAPVKSDASEAGGGDTAAPAAEKRVAADTPPTGEADPAAVAEAIASNAEASTGRLTLAENEELSRQIKGLDDKLSLDQHGPSNVLITVVGPKEGMRRAGKRFGPEAVTFCADDITHRQFLMLQDEPRLIVSLEQKPVEEG